MNFLIPLLYILLFAWLIYKLKFFRESGLSPAVRIGIFVLKVLTGIFVIFIYTNYYRNPSTADILQYYADGKVMADSFWSNPSDFFKMFSGVGCNTEYFYTKYFSVMERWQRYHDSLFFNDCHTIIRFNAFADIFSFGAFHVNTVFMCFFSFTGLTALYRSFSKFFEKKKTLFLLAIFFPPALLFWSSALLKEGILMFSMGFFIYACLRIFVERKVNLAIVLMLVAGLYFFIFNKIYILILIFPPLLAYIIFSKLNVRFKWLGYIFIHLLIISGGLFFAKKVLNKDFVQEIITHQRDFINVAKGGLYLIRDNIVIRLNYDQKDRLIPTGRKDTVFIKQNSNYEYWLNGNMEDTLHVTNSTDTSRYWNIWKIEPARSAYYMPHLKYNFSSFMSYAPRAFLNVALRPYVNETENLYQKICSFENIFYLIVLALCFFLGDYKNCNWNLFWLGIFFTVNLFLIIGFTTPVAGALVRYKGPALPFLLMSAFSLLNVEKVRKIPLLKYLVGR
jgi:hypothetical protein